MISANAVVAAIDEAYASEPEPPARSYIGASIVGSNCDAYLAFSLRGFPGTAPAPRNKRIFKLGHTLEDIVVADLKKAGLTIFEVDPFTRRQHELSLYGGHVSSHMDGQVEDGDDVLGLEIKSMKASSFNKYKTYGVKVSHPSYFAQMQMMMGMGDFTRFLFIAYNKDTSEYHAEIVDADAFYYAFLNQKVERVLDGDARKAGGDATFWSCKGCFKRGVCWEDQDVEPWCRTCAHAGPTPDGEWHCYRTDDAVKAKDTCPSWTRYAPKPRL